MTIDAEGMIIESVMPLYDVVIAEHLVVDADAVTTYCAARGLDLLTVRTPLLELVLGERVGREIAFGAVGRFWQPVIEWRDVDAADFAGFSEPGWGKIAANFSVPPYGLKKSLLSYECRTATTDPESHRRFARYWLLIRPLVAHILRAALRQIKTDVEATP